MQDTAAMKVEALLMGEWVISEQLSAEFQTIAPTSEWQKGKSGGGFSTCPASRLHVNSPKARPIPEAQ
jgi:hypothetical protein